MYHVKQHIANLKNQSECVCLLTGKFNLFTFIIVTDILEFICPVIFYTLILPYFSFLFFLFFFKDFF